MIRLTSDEMRGGNGDHIARKSYLYRSCKKYILGLSL